MKGNETKSLQITSELNESRNKGMPKRRDCSAIKEALIKRINAEEYINTLNNFFQGNCSKEQFDKKMRTILNTTKARLLHNMLMSSIIYNAHFSVSPPQNISCPTASELKDPELVEFQPADKTESSQSLESLVDYHLPSIEQLSSRIKTMILEMGIDSVDFQAVQLIYKSVLSFVMLILSNSIEFTKEISLNNSDEQNLNQNQEKEKDMFEPISIKFQNVLQVIESNHQFSDIADAEVISKYKLLIDKQKE